MGIIQKLKRTREILNSEIDRSISKDLTAFQRLMVYIDVKKEMLFHGISFLNYFQFEFYWKNQRERRRFACKRETEFVYNKYNPEKFRYMTGDKASFNKRFNEYLGRKWLDVESSSYEEFVKFMDSMDRVFAKPGNGECGIGTEVVVNTGKLDYKALYEIYKEAQVMLEEVVVQHDALAEFNPSSVNTLRIMSLRDAHDDVHILACVLRMGRKGEVADNFNHRGICAAIDKDTGIVYSVGIDQNHNKYIVHPDSGKPIVGFVIPQWEEIKKLVVIVAKELKELRYVGWDITVTQDGRITIIEGNSMPGSTVTQIADQIGKWQDYKVVMDIK